MPDQKISQLTAGGAAQATDLLPVARSGTNVSLLAKDIATALERLAASGQSLTGSQATSLVDLAATWNTTGTPTAIKLNVTNTASNANSLLMDLQVGGASRFQVMVAGNTYANGGSKVIIGDTLQLTGTGGGSVADYAFVAAPTGAIGSGILAAGQRYGFTSGFGLYVGTQPITWGANANVTASYPDLYITRDAANTLAQRNSTNAQTFRLYTRYDTASDFRRLTLTSATYSGVEYSQILAETGGTYASSNVGIVLSPKGTGAFSLQMPDGTTAGGNARGTRAVDLQLSRSAAANVASGNDSFAAGLNSRASGSSSVAIGDGNTASGYYAIAIGNGATASSTSAVSLGASNTSSAQSAFSTGQFTTASAYTASSFGYYGTASGTSSFATGAFPLADKYGQFAVGLGPASGSTNPNAQWSVLGFRGETTTASATEIFLHGVSNTRATVPANTTWMATLMVTARTRNGISNAAFERRCIIKRDGSNNTALVGTVQTIGTDIKTDTDLDLSVTITADDTNEALKLEVTGKMGGTVSTLTSSGTTCTLTSTANHGLSTGDYVTIAGANETAYNGTFVITRTGATTFTYTAATTPSATPATGTITANINCRWVARVDCVEVGHPV